MRNNTTPSFFRRPLAAGSALAALTVLPPVRTVAVYSPPSAVARPYIYPMHGQCPDQIERDRYDCYVSAVQQTGFDPAGLAARIKRSWSRPRRGPAQRPAPSAVRS
jgi:hypothetical protein